MIKKTFLVGLLLVGYVFMTPSMHQPVRAGYDPLSVPNNRIGVHLLEPAEIFDAAKLANSMGGDWGYVTIPIRSDDRNPAKWTEFFKNCRELHLIPIIRLMTYVDKEAWETPTVYDLVDFANFLSDMPWPTNNRYIILFNEPNHSKEWGGHLSPSDYAKLLVDAKNIFKARSGDFFMLTAGMDMSAPTNRTSQDALAYYRQMTQAVPNWLDAVDGLSLHPYPNPGFSSSVTSTTRFGIKSYTYELKYLKSLGLTRAATLPLFITETGKPSQGNFYTPAITSVWTDPNIVAITPFILFAASPDFKGFSLLDTNHAPTQNYKDILAIAKKPGSPLLNPNIAVQTVPPAMGSSAPISSTKTSLWTNLKAIFTRPTPELDTKKLQIKDTTLTIEIADTDATRQHGLSDRQDLAPDQGMLFIFPSAHRQSFWMKDMHFALDMLWIKNGKIVAISENVPPPDQTNGIPKQLSPNLQVDQVLEVNAGFTNAHNIQTGDEIKIQN